MKETSLRQKRVAAEIQGCLSQIIRQEFAHHPVLSVLPITIMDVVISPDLRHVRAHVMPLGGGDSRALLEALNAAIPTIRKFLAQTMMLRVVPHLAFKAVAEVPSVTTLPSS